MEKETTNELQNELQNEQQNELPMEKVVDEATKKARLAVELASGQEFDWEAEEAKEEEQNKAQAEIKIEAEKEKAEAELKFLESLDNITRIKLENSFTNEERALVLEHSRIYNEPIKDVIQNKDVLKYIDQSRKIKIKPIPQVVEKTSEDTYMSSGEWLKKYKEIIK